MVNVTQTKLSSTISLPIYRRIEEDLRDRISSGVWLVDSRIPGRRELAKEYCVEVSTVQRAIANLIGEGVLRAESGRGTFVAIGRGTPGEALVPPMRFGVFLRDPEKLSSLDSYLSFTVMGIRRALAPYGIQHSITFVEDRDLDQISRLPRSEMAGILFASPDIDKRTLIDHLWRSGLPLVVAGASWTGMAAPHVDSDNAGGTDAVLDLLVSRGHRKIACGVVNVNSCHHYDRGQAFQAGMARRGLPISNGHLIEMWKPSPQDGTDAFYRLLTSKDRPTALITTDPGQAVNCLRIAQELGLRVPEDLSITTFDNVDVITHLRPPLTTVAAPFAEMGEIAMRLLIDLCSGKTIAKWPGLLDMTLIERSSVGFAPDTAG